MITSIGKRARTLEVTQHLMRRALGCPICDHGSMPLSSSLQQRLVRVATAHSIANLIGTCDHAEIDHDLRAFFGFMRTQNAGRNAHLREQLNEAGSALSVDAIDVIALKGAAELVAPIYPSSADRFMGDLDLLIPEDRIDDAIAVLSSLGYSTRDAPYDRRNRHAPAMWHEAWPTAIELHTAVTSSEVLEASALIRRSRSTVAPPLRVPAPVDRLCHLITHAQVDSHRYAGHWFLLRDAADLWALSRAIGTDDWVDVRRRFALAGASNMLDGFLEAASHILGRPIHDWETSSIAKAWAQKTLSLLAWPEVHRAAYLFGTIRYYVRGLVAQPALRKKYAADMNRPSTVRDFLTRHTDALRGFQ